MGEVLFLFVPNGFVPLTCFHLLLLPLRTVRPPSSLTAKPALVPRSPRTPLVRRASSSPPLLSIRIRYQMVSASTVSTCFFLRTVPFVSGLVLSAFVFERLGRACCQPYSAPACAESTLGNPKSQTFQKYEFLKMTIQNLRISAFGQWVGTGFQFGVFRETFVSSGRENGV